MPRPRVRRGRGMSPADEFWVCSQALKRARHGQQRQLARALDGAREHALILGAQPGSAARQNLALRVDVAAQALKVLVVRRQALRGELVHPLGAGRLRVVVAGANILAWLLLAKGLLATTEAPFGAARKSTVTYSP